ncbi:MAG: NADH-quinone oxidoreductase subunit C, partial [Candidatus Omnitrophota bacterium]
MKYENLIQEIERKYKIDSMKVAAIYTDEVYIDVSLEDFNSICAALHEKLKSAVMTLFAVDEGSERGLFTIICVFMGVEYKKWFLARTRINRDNPRFASLSKQIYSAAFFEREMKEMFGIELIDNPDARSLRLHEEVWTEKNYPLRKDFTPSSGKDKTKKEYIFNRIEGEGVFEVPVGPVHAGIIGPGHFRFSAAGEPIINLETRLGFTHRGIEKLFEGKKTGEAVKIAEHVCGDSSFSHSLAFCRAVEKISGIIVPARDAYSREIFLELERLYNH